MGKSRLVIRLLVLLATILAITTVSLGVALAGSGPELRILSASPVKVKGKGFHALERLRLTIKTVSMRRVLRIKVSTSGSFRRTVTRMDHFDPCLGPLRVTAIGNHGSRAKATLPQRECAPSL
jgi:hypothetical protein